MAKFVIIQVMSWMIKTRLKKFVGFDYYNAADEMGVSSRGIPIVGKLDGNGGTWRSHVIKGSVLAFYFRSIIKIELR